MSAARQTPVGPGTGFTESWLDGNDKFWPWFASRPTV